MHSGWLLFGKDSSDKKDYDLIPHKLGAVDDIGCGKEPTCFRSARVSGKTISFQKSLPEEWPEQGRDEEQVADGRQGALLRDDLEG